MAPCTGSRWWRWSRSISCCARTEAGQGLPLTSTATADPAFPDYRCRRLRVRQRCQLQHEKGLHTAPMKIFQPSTMHEPVATLLPTSMYQAPADMTGSQGSQSLRRTHDRTPRPAVATFPAHIPFTGSQRTPAPLSSPLPTGSRSPLQRPPSLTLPGNRPALLPSHCPTTRLLASWASLSPSPPLVQLTGLRELVLSGPLVCLFREHLERWLLAALPGCALALRAGEGGAT